MSFSDPSDRLEAWLRAELARPRSRASAAAGKQRVMELVRAEARAARRAPARGASQRHGSRLLGLALAAGLSGVVAFNSSRPFPGSAMLDSAQVRLVDTVAGALADTVRIVRFALVAPTATTVALVGDFNRWDPRATPLARAESTWATALALGAGRHRYAFVVDDTQWIADPASALDDTVRGRPASVLELPGARE